MYERILMPIDGSLCSEHAIEEGLKLAKTFGSEVTFLYVLENPLTGYFSVYDVAGAYTNLFEDLRKGAEETLAQAKKRATDAGIKAETKLIDFSYPINAIVETEDDFDLIIMGTHGRRGLNRFFLGSVCEGVLRRSSKPHLIVRCPDLAPEKDEVELPHAAQQSRRAVMG